MKETGKMGRCMGQAQVYGMTGATKQQENIWDSIRKASKKDTDNTLMRKAQYTGQCGITDRSTIKLRQMWKNHSDNFNQFY